MMVGYGTAGECATGVRSTEAVLARVAGLIFFWVEMAGWRVNWRSNIKSAAVGGHRFQAIAGLELAAEAVGESVEVLHDFLRTQRVRVAQRPAAEGRPTRP